MTLFKRPAWAQTRPANEDSTPDDLFRHSSRSHEAIVAEQHRKKQERAEKQRVKQERRERRDSSKRQSDDSDDEVGSSRKKQKNTTTTNRRITSEESKEILSSVGLSPSVGIPKVQGREEIQYEAEQGSHRTSPRFKKAASKDEPKVNLRSASAKVIELEDSDSEGEGPQHHAPPPEPAPPAEPESDDEFAELRRQARARKQKGDAAKKSQTPDGRSPTPGQAAGEEETGLPTPPPAPDPPVKILVWSDLPNTNPLIVWRKLSQRSQEIRVAWCQKQGFSEEFTKDIFLVHRTRRLYDSTTCRSLGLYVDDNGKLAIKNGQMPEDAQVHLQAVTSEMFERMKAERAQEERQREKLAMPQNEDDAGEGADEAQEKPKEVNVKIMLRAKNVSQPFKLKVKPVGFLIQFQERLLTPCRRRFSQRSWRLHEVTSASLSGNSSGWNLTVSDSTRTRWSKPQRSLIWTTWTCTLHDTVASLRHMQVARHSLSCRVFAAEHSSEHTHDAYILMIPNIYYASSYTLFHHARSFRYHCILTGGLVAAFCPTESTGALLDLTVYCACMHA